MRAEKEKQKETVFEGNWNLLNLTFFGDNESSTYT